MTPAGNTRQYIRHPTAIPISAEKLDTVSAGEAALAQDVGIGGLSFTSGQQFDIGNILSLKISLLVPPFETHARVVWSHPLEKGSETGVEFLSRDDAYCARMTEQICHIEAYKLEIAKTEGRLLTSNEAAAEWIAKYAPTFPGGETDQNS